MAIPHSPATIGELRLEVAAEIFLDLLGPLIKQQSARLGLGTFGTRGTAHGLAPFWKLGIPFQLARPVFLNPTAAGSCQPQQNQQNQCHRRAQMGAERESAHGMRRTKEEAESGRNYARTAADCRVQRARQFR